MKSSLSSALSRIRQRVKPTLAAIGLSTVIAVSPAQAVGSGSGTVLYDAVDQGAVLPSSAPWSRSYAAVVNSLDPGSFANRGMSNPAANTFLSTSTDAQAGYSKTIANGLNSTMGFSIDFSLRLVSESHVSDNRSGLSLIVLDSAAKGVEISFWTDEVWLKNADTAFSHSATERIATSTTALERTYRLTFLNGNYTLAIDGSDAFGGGLRNYGAIASGFPATLVYNSSNFVFFGDNTSSAAANFELGNTTLAPVPEPGTWLMMLAGLSMLLVFARRSRLAAKMTNA